MVIFSFFFLKLFFLKNMFTNIHFFYIFCLLFFLRCFLVVRYVCCWHMHGLTGFNLARSHVFFLGTWIGSNDLMISSACVTDFFDTRAWQQ